MVGIPHALRKIKEDLPRVLSSRQIEQACRSVKHRWRRRQLPPVRTVYLFVLQILHGNIACSALRHVSGLKVSASAYCQARARLPLAAIKALVGMIASDLVGHCDRDHRWHGHRVIHIDGSGFSMPDTKELQAHFGQPGGQKKGCGFPVAHLCAITHAGSGMVMDLFASPLRTHDMADAAKLHSKMKPGDVLVGDRGFCSYAHFALILQGQMHAVFRVHQRQIVCFGRRRHATDKTQRGGGPNSLFVRSLGREDQVVHWLKPKCRPKWMNAEQFASLPASIPIREVRYTIKRRGFRIRRVTLVTTLLDPEPYSKEELAQVYFERWQIEVNFRDLKQSMGMDVLRCHSVDGLLKELWMFVLVYNLVRMVMMQAARKQNVEPDRISFVDALRWLQYCRPREDLCDLIVNPRREGRVEPRVRKRRPKSYPLLTVPRSKLRKLLKTQRVAS